ncbi:MAG: energy transducer TonB [Nostoc indistinguendum CM1-VF10]|jgi:TonB family protein|nr:energy transducer TonB [Nostoc indistinguendum CM1-VF10]
MMSFSSIAVGFFAYSTMNSLVLHIPVLFSDIGHFIKASEKSKQVKQLKQVEMETQQFPTVESPQKKLTQCLSLVRDSRASQSSTVSDNLVPSNNLGGSGSNTALDLKSRNQPENPSTVAPLPTPPKINTPGNSRAACQECRSKYPESARRRSVEGRVEIAVDTDAQGNVTNVRLIRSSGNRNLDEETLRQARNWKFKPASDGRQEVSVATEYAIAGSCHHLQLQERRRRDSSQTEN